MSSDKSGTKGIQKEKDIKILIILIEWTFTLLRSSNPSKPGDTITRSLMVGYGVPAVIVLIMGIGNDSISN